MVLLAPSTFSRSGRQREFTFDAFDVDLDFAEGTAVVYDVVGGKRSQTYLLHEIRARLPHR